MKVSETGGREAPKNKHGQTCEETCGPMAATGYHSLLCPSVERILSAPTEAKAEERRESKGETK